MNKYKIIPSTDNIQHPYEFNYFSTYCPENVKCSAREIQESEGDFFSICALMMMKTHASGHDTQLNCDIKGMHNEDFFSVSVTWKNSKTGKPFAYSYGCYDENKADEVWEKMLKDVQEKGLFISPQCLKERPRAPFVCDAFVFPRAVNYSRRVDFELISEYVRRFFKCFASYEFSLYSKLEGAYWGGDN